MMIHPQLVRSEFPAILFTGDLTWPDDVGPTLALSPKLLESVSVVPNLEGALRAEGSARRLRRGATCGLWNGIGVLDLLGGAHFEVVGVANNHFTDFDDGARDTLEELRRRQVVGGGGGVTQEHANRPVRMMLGDGMCATIAFAADWRVGCVAPRFGRAGVNVMAAPDSCADIARLRADFPDDLIVASVHAGEELQSTPAPYVRNWFRALAAAGADLVLGHHPHVPHGVERVGGSWLFYSLGNLLMGARQYDGIALEYPSEAEVSIGVIVDSRGVQVIRLASDPHAGVVRQEGNPAPPEAVMSRRFAGLMSLSDADYALAYKRARTVSWWYPVWTGLESRAASAFKASWLRTVQVSRGLLVRRRTGKRRVAR